jgi:hypothetical protein
MYHIFATPNFVGFHDEQILTASKAVWMQDFGPERKLAFVEFPVKVIRSSQTSSAGFNLVLTGAPEFVVISPQGFEIERNFEAFPGLKNMQKAVLNIEFLAQVFVVADALAPMALEDEVHKLRMFHDGTGTLSFSGSVAGFENAIELFAFHPEQRAMMALEKEGAVAGRQFVLKLIGAAAWRAGENLDEIQAHVHYHPGLFDISHMNTEQEARYESVLRKVKGLLN